MPLRPFESTIGSCHCHFPMALSTVAAASHEPTNLRGYLAGGLSLQCNDGADVICWLRTSPPLFAESAFPAGYRPRTFVRSRHEVPRWPTVACYFGACATPGRPVAFPRFFHNNPL